MKTRFQSNTELANVWAMQTQSHGKGNSMFFNHKTAYSYGFHYMAGELLTLKGEKICILNSTPSSVTTRKHVNELRAAAIGKGYKCFSLPFGRVFDQNKICVYLTELIKEAEGLLRKQFNARTTTFNFERAEYLIYQVIELARLFNEKQPKPEDFKLYTELKKKIYGV